MEKYKFAAVAFFVIFFSWQIGQAQSEKETVKYAQGEELELVIPRVLDQYDLGKAYPRTATGLEGTRVVPNRSESHSDTLVRSFFYKFTDGLILNLWGTGLGMHSSTLPVETDIRRAQFTLMKIVRTEELAEEINHSDLDAMEKPILLTGIDYGYSFNLSISGPKSRFNNEVFELLEAKIANREPIDTILQKYSLAGTRALRGIKSLTVVEEIPTDWEDLKTKYRLGEPIPVFGRYLALEDLETQKIIWSE